MAGALQRSRYFRGLPDAQLRKLRRAGERRAFAAGDELDGGLLYVVAAGEVIATTPPDADGVSQLVSHEGPGSVFGRDGDPLVYRAVEPVDALVWDDDTLERLLGRDDGLRRQLDTRLSLRRRQSELVDLLRRTPLFARAGQSSVRSLIGSATLARFEPGDVICRQGDQGDELFVIASGEVDVARDESPESVRKLRRGDFFGEIALVQEAPRTATAVAATGTEVLVVGRHEVQVLCGRSSSFRQAMRTSAEIRLEGDRTARPEFELVWLVNDTDWPTQHLADLLTAALRTVGAPELVHSAEGDLAGRAGSIVHVGRDAAARLPGQVALLQTVHDVVLGGRTDGALVRPDAFVLPPLVEGAPLDGQPPPAHQVLLRLARAIARRRVGVALGGGAAWGLAHVALLRGLERARIPVDIVVGVSAGSLVGAFYASQGAAGLERLVGARLELAASAFAAIGTTSVVELFVRHHIPERRIEALALPFAAVAVEARTGRERIFRHGSLAAAVRASCSLPGVFGRQLGRGERYLDACVRHNVPVSYCTEAGADFVIACDVVPPPSPTGGGRSGLRRRALELLQVDRLTDTVRSLYWMASTSRDLQAGLADAVFTPNLAEFAPWDFHRADEIAARAEEQLDGWLDTTAARYQALCRAPQGDG